MTDTVIHVDHISKRYSLQYLNGRRDAGLRHTIQDAATAPFRIMASLGRREKGPRATGTDSRSKWDSKAFYALKGISFEVARGEVVGIVGRNGAGKSTLLKILSRITEPTEGRVRIKGRVASLLEVGTGFHPELTGRENVYLNGTILGMRRSEINRKFDEIIAFAGVEKFLDMPLKRYSSGMGIRLAFAVAAHLEAEILLVDEVLAVGDPGFQQKCVGKMRDVTRQGRTILFVSHNMPAVRDLCGRVMLLDGGMLVRNGDPSRVISEFLGNFDDDSPVATADTLAQLMTGRILRDTPTVRFKEIRLTDTSGNLRSRFTSREEVRITVTYECFTPVTDLRIVIHVLDEMNTRVLSTQNVDLASESAKRHFAPGTYLSECVLPRDLFGSRRYYLTVQLIHGRVEKLLVDRALGFSVEFGGYNKVHHSNWGDALVRPLLQWRTSAPKPAAVAGVANEAPRD